MKIISVKDFKSMSEFAAQIVIKEVRTNPSIRLGLATGSTPIGVYQELINDYIQNGTTYQNVQTFNLDEYVGLEKGHPNSYYDFMKKQLFNHIDIPSERTHIPSGTARDMDEECLRYEQLIIDSGGVDLQLLGIGQNGHIGFNEPFTPFNSRTHLVELSDNTRQANSRFFETLDDVPTHAITMGIATILASKEIILLASGNKKRFALERLVNGDINEDFPASALKLHPKVTVIADEEALSLINR